eukprot:TRINITY_DN3143_c0_g1_i1.p1 TRINITY_DN3143_c0_g1~~TRINITY_DN3143_c0_g1_i1.p1  ORF type:complete len:382 (+),score=105.37 TRINITY_DN3143_c0_g1_i1:221-1366(+)
MQMQSMKGKQREGTLLFEGDLDEGALLLLNLAIEEKEKQKMDEDDDTQNLFKSLPFKIFTKILSYLMQPGDVFSASLVSLDWKRAIGSHNFWREACDRKNWSLPKSKKHTLDFRTLFFEKTKKYCVACGVRSSVVYSIGVMCKKCQSRESDSKYNTLYPTMPSLQESSRDLTLFSEVLEGEVASKALSKKNSESKKRKSDTESEEDQKRTRVSPPGTPPPSQPAAFASSSLQQLPAQLQQELQALPVQQKQSLFAMVQQQLVLIFQILQPKKFEGLPTKFLPGSQAPVSFLPSSLPSPSNTFNALPLPTPSSSPLKINSSSAHFSNSLSNLTMSLSNLPSLPSSTLPNLNPALNSSCSISYLPLNPISGLRNSASLNLAEV